MVNDSTLKSRNSKADSTISQAPTEFVNKSHKRETNDLIAGCQHQVKTTSVSVNSQFWEGRSNGLLGLKDVERFAINAEPTVTKILHSDQPLLDARPNACITRKATVDNVRQSVEVRLAVITPSLLHSLFSISLPEAARAVGVTVYAFKRACRNLGISRWPFRRGPNHEKRCSPPLQAMKNTKATAEVQCDGISASPTKGLEQGTFIDSDCIPDEWLADGCRALEQEWASVRSAAGALEASRGSLLPEGSAPLADDKLVLDMLSRPWQ